MRNVLVGYITFTFFSCERGVRQGDPLSPLLFCLVEDVLSRGITLLVMDKKLYMLSSPRGVNAPSHIFCANDLIVFSKADLGDIDNLLSLFECYGEASGQIVSVHKCSVFIFGKHMLYQGR